MFDTYQHAENEAADCQNGLVVEVRNRYLQRYSKIPGRPLRA